MNVRSGQGSQSDAYQSGPLETRWPRTSLAHRLLARGRKLGASVRQPLVWVVPIAINGKLVEAVVFAKNVRAALEKIATYYTDAGIDSELAGPVRRERMGERCRLVTDGWVAK